MSTNPLLELTKLGQSIWIDHLGRGRIASGELARHIEQDGLRGVTSNPSIFEQAITGDRRRWGVQVGRHFEAHEASVASFFLSRIDVLVDQRLDELERDARIDAAPRG